MLEEMKEEIDEADIPAEYGGQLQGEVYNATKEKEFWEHVQRLNSTAWRRDSSWMCHGLHWLLQHYQYLALLCPYINLWFAWLYDNLSRYTNNQV